MSKRLALVLLLSAASMRADEPVAKPPVDSPRHRVYHADGTILNGTLAPGEIRINTPAGELKVAVDKLRSLTPKIARRSRRAQRIGDLIRELGAKKFVVRDRAQQELAAMGTDARTLLEAARDDADAERRTRARRLLKRLGPRSADDAEVKDRLEADGKIVLRGRLLTKRIEVRTPYGDYSADLSDIDYLGPSSAGKPVNLLTKIDPARDSIGPRWTLDKNKGTLTSPRARLARMQIPMDVPAAYQLDLVVTPKVGRSVGGKLIADTLMVAIVVDGHPCQVALNGFTSLGKGTLSGLDRIDGKRPPDYASHQGEIFIMGRASTVRCRVAPGRVGVDCDGKQIVDWRGDSALLSTHSAWLLRRPKSLGLGSYLTSFELTRLVLTPLHHDPPLPKLADGYARLELRDGQRIVGKPLEWPTLTTAADATRRFVLAEVVAATISAEGKKLEATLRGGATVTAATPPKTLRIACRPGTLSVPVANIRRIVGLPVSESK